MSRRCCTVASCACVLAEGNSHIQISGSGSTQDPFVLVGDVALSVTDSSTINFTLSGGGTIASPWNITGIFATSSKLDDLGDVNAPAPTAGQGIMWDTGTSKWINQALPVAAPGFVTTDTSIQGDGSGGSPLGVTFDPAGGLGDTGSGVTINAATLSELVLRFPNSATRTTDVPSPVLNQLTMLDTNPGRIDYWDGTAWTSVQNVLATGGQYLNLSGAFAGQAVTLFTKQLSATTDGSGLFTVLSTADLTGSTGVLAVTFQETGTSIFYKAQLRVVGSEVVAVARKLTDGTTYPSVAITGIVTAWLY